MRKLFVFLAFLAANVAAVAAQGAALTTRPARPPNVVLIFADDLGWRDVGFNGADFYETPNLDRLSKEGMTFPNAYAAAGNCAPSRACLLSGQYTPRHGVYAVGDTDRGPKNLMRLIPIPNAKGLTPKQVTVAEVLKANGYATGIFGKWHLGGRDGAPPAAQGFDVVFDQHTGGPPKVNDDPKGAYSILRKAEGFIEANRDRPFFCYVAHHAIHAPLEARPETIARFRKKAAGQKDGAAMYAACLYDFDDTVGQLVKKLADLGLERDTLVIFTSDNGGTPQSPQEPLRGNKGSYYEGGIRVPMFARWPGLVKPGTTSNVPVINLDLYPTFLDAAGAKVPEGKLLDGESLLPLLKGGSTTLARPAIFWHFPGYLDVPVIRGRDPIFRTRPVTAMRAGDWKVLLYHEEWQLDGGQSKLDANDAVEIYDLAADPGERNNLARSDPKKRDELVGQLLGWMKSADAKMPSQPNAAYDPKRKPDKPAGGGGDD